MYIYFMNKNKIGLNIRLLRKQKGYTQTDLAKKLDCTQGIITAYENGKKKPAADRIPAIAKVLGVSTDELLGNVAVKNDQAPKNMTLWKKFQKIQQMEPGERRAIFKMIDSLAAR